MHLSGVLQSRNMSSCAGLRVNGTCGIVPLPSSQANIIITVTPLLGFFLPMRVVTNSDCPSSPRSALRDPTLQVYAPLLYLLLPVYRPTKRAGGK
jgi:hypothetical protein